MQSEVVLSMPNTKDYSDEHKHCMM